MVLFEDILYQKFYLLANGKPCLVLRSSTVNGGQDGDKDLMRSHAQH